MTDFAVNPPPPSRIADYENSGQQLQGLLRSLERRSAGNSRTSDADDSNDAEHLMDKEFRSIIATLQLLIQSVSRHGLLRGDEELATSLLAASRGDNNANSNKKRPNKQQQQQQRGLIHDDAIADKSGFNATTSSNAHLIITCLIRILGGQQQQQQQQQQASLSNDRRFSKPLQSLAQREDHCLMIWLAADVCSGSFEFIRKQHQQSSGPCAAAEFELLSSHAKPLLNGLANTMEDLLACCCSNGSGASTESSVVLFPMHEGNADREIICRALRSCQRAATSLVSLLGTRLSRHGAHLERLSQVGVWKSVAVVGMMMMDAEMVDSAAALHSALPLAGAALLGKQGSGPAPSSSEQWSKALKEVTAMTFVLLQSAAPVNQSLAERAQHHDLFLQTTTSTGRRETLDLWLQRIGVTDSEEEKSLIFVHCITALVSIATHLISMETIGCNNRLLDAELDLVSMLDLVEILMSFPVSAELLYFGTKKRLRKEPLDSGQFSPEAMIHMASRIKVLGHRLLKDILASVKGAQLLPFARRLFKTSYGALLTSSSTALRNVLEDKGPLSLDSNRRKWLNGSIVVRTAAIQSVRRVVLTVGMEPCRTRNKSFGVGKKGDGEVDRMVNLVCGCLIEQLNGLTNPAQNKDEWGSVKERMDCLVASADCISAFLVSSGPFLSNVARTLVDSVAKTFISHCSNLPQDRISHLASVCCCALSLGSQSCSTPWMDGASSSLGPFLRDFAQQLQQTTDSALVSSAALAAIRVCNSLDTLRVPAIAIITRAPAKTATGFTDASKLTDRLGEAMKMPKRQEKSTDSDKKKEAKRRKTTESETRPRDSPKGKEAIRLKDPPATAAAVSKPQSVSTDLPETATKAHVSSSPAQQLQSEGPSPVAKSVSVAQKNSSGSLETQTDFVDSAKPAFQTTAGLKIPEEEKNPAEDSDDELGEMPMIVDAPPDEEDR